MTHAGAPLPEADVLQWTRALLDALGYLHAQKPPVIHRDVNPRNVKIAPDGKLKLIDFGIAKLFATGAGTGAAARAVSAPYSPMEQYGGGTDARSDIYALGATLYHLLTNHLPPDAPSRAIQSLTPPRQLNFALSDATEAIILKAMAINAADRFPSAADMQAAMHPPVPAATVSASRASVVRRLLARFSTWLRRAQTPLWAVGIIVLVLVLCESALLFYVQSDVQSAQKTIQAQVTSIAQANATATRQASNIEEAQRVMTTQTAVIAQAQQAATAQAATFAAVQRTATAQAQAIPTIQALESGFVDLALRAARVYSPGSGRLDHKDDGAVKYTSAKVDLRDLIVEARFFNPYDRADKPWDYGFAFRSTAPNKEYRLIITSLGRWELKLTDMVDGRFASDLVAEGEAENLDVSTSGSNSLRLFVKGGTAFLIVNGKHIATLDASRRIASGDVAIVTGFYGAAHHMPGKATRYEGFAVWSLPGGTEQHPSPTTMSP